MDPKHPLRPLTGKLSKGGHESFQMRYYMTLYVKGLQNCGPSKMPRPGIEPGPAKDDRFAIQNRVQM